MLSLIKLKQRISVTYDECPTQYTLGRNQFSHKICPQETRLLLAYRGQILTKVSRLRNILSRNKFFIIAMSQKYQPACPSTKYFHSRWKWSLVVGMKNQCYQATNFWGTFSPCENSKKNLLIHVVVYHLNCLEEPLIKAEKKR